MNDMGVDKCLRRTGHDGKHAGACSGVTSEGNACGVWFDQATRHVPPGKCGTHGYILLDERQPIERRPSDPDLVERARRALIPRNRVNATATAATVPEAP
jgi:hypothetical protein